MKQLPDERGTIACRVCTPPLVEIRISVNPLGVPVSPGAFQFPSVEHACGVKVKSVRVVSRWYCRIYWVVVVGQIVLTLSAHQTQIGVASAH